VGLDGYAGYRAMLNALSASGASSIDREQKREPAATEDMIGK